MRPECDLGGAMQTGSLLFCAPRGNNRPQTALGIRGLCLLPLERAWKVQICAKLQKDQVFLPGIPSDDCGFRPWAGFPEPAVA